MTSSWIYLGVLLLTAMAPLGFASPLFDSDAPLDVVFAGPVAELRREKSPDPPYLPFEMRSQGETLAVLLRPRGASRRAICKMPPLRLKFADMPAASVFSGQSRLKLVTHCNASRSAEQNALEEFAAYRILQLLTPASFRVRLLRITYLDSDRQRKAETTWGFLIESVEQLAARVDGVHVEPDFIASGLLDEEHSSVVGLFQYLIGNTDFSLTNRRPGQPCCHNTKAIQQAEHVLSVPYDFDQAGLVDASYAGANPVHSGTNVRRRAYFGLCTSVEFLAGSLEHVREKRALILALPGNIPGMTQATRKRAVRYIEGFYRRLEKQGVGYLHQRCKSQ